MADYQNDPPPEAPPALAWLLGQSLWGPDSNLFQLVSHLIDLLFQNILLAFDQTDHVLSGHLNEQIPIAHPQFVIALNFAPSERAHSLPVVLFLSIILNVLLSQNQNLLSESLNLDESLKSGLHLWIDLFLSVLHTLIN